MLGARWGARGMRSAPRAAIERNMLVVEAASAETDFRKYFPITCEAWSAERHLWVTDDGGAQAAEYVSRGARARADG